MVGRQSLDYDDEWERGKDQQYAMSRCYFGRHGVAVAVALAMAVAVAEAPMLDTMKSGRDC